MKKGMGNNRGRKALYLEKNKDKYYSGFLIQTCKPEENGGKHFKCWKKNLPA